VRPPSPPPTQCYAVVGRGDLVSERGGCRRGERRASLSPVGANVGVAVGVAVGARVGRLVSPRLVGTGVGAARAEYGCMRCRSRNKSAPPGAAH
jgi:hypothetical protein